MACKINLTHRGPQVISGFDLFDECHYGADKLFLRGHFCCPSAVEKQIRIALDNTESPALLDIAKLEDIYETTIDKEFLSSKLGIGNPLTKTPEDGDLENVPVIALNRHHIVNKKFWNDVIPDDVENPYKASAAVKFAIRVFFKDDSAFIVFGCPWEFTNMYGNIGSLNESSSADDFFNNMVLFSNHNISREDTLEILSKIVPNIVENTASYKEITSSSHELIVSELMDETGSIISF